jgi:hypothetical protein
MFARRCLTVLCSLGCGWLFLSPLSASAQDGRPVSCRFVCMDGATPPQPMLHVGGKSVEVACPIPANNLSDPVICYAKENVITFLTSHDRKPAATAKIPSDQHSAILVFIPAPSPPSPLPWRVFVVDDSAKSFPDGGAFVANFFSKDIRFVIGEHKVQLRPSQSHGVASPTQRDEFNMAQVVFQFQEETTWRTASESLLRFLPGMRYLICAYIDPASGRPRIATFQDRAPAPVKAPAKP